jgi:hypothetical protein
MVERLDVAAATGRRQGGGMTLRPLLRATALLATGFALAGCAAYKSGMGTDPLSHSEAELVTWSDGAPAVAIQCLEVRGCGQRARTICLPRGLKVLKRAVSVEAIAAAEEQGGSGLPSIVVRCG